MGLPNVFNSFTFFQVHLALQILFETLLSFLMTSPRISIPRFCFCLWVNGIHRKFALIATIKPYGLSLGKSGKLEKKKMGEQGNGFDHFEGIEDRPLN